MKNIIQNTNIRKIILPVLFAGVLVLALAILLAASTAEAEITSQLDRGDRGSDVTELQTFLAADASLYPEGLVTGYYGPLTEAAVQRFQCRHNIVCSGTAATTGYGRVGPRTMAELRIQMGFGGGVGGSDVNAPIMGTETVTRTSNSATISWTTSEPSRSRVMYGTNWPFLYATAQSSSDASLDSSQNITISGLQSNKTYFYVRESVDASGNIMWATAKTFTTQ